MELKNQIPWWIKIISKILLSRFGLSYQQWRHLGIFTHGAMLDYKYAIEVFQNHYSKSMKYLPDNYSLLELGPGDSISTAIIATTFGSIKTWLVDSESFASHLIEDYYQIFEYLDIPVPGSIEELLAITNTHYLINALESLREIKSNSVDFIFSHAVLEHVSIHDFNDTINELYRIQNPGGVSSHRIDLMDHLSKSLHSLRFSRDLWESAWFAKSGFYTNRLRANEIMNSFSQAGFVVLHKEFDCWDAIPLNRKSIHPEFDHISDSDLKIYGMDIIFMKPKTG